MVNVCFIIRDRLSLTAQALESLEKNTDMEAITVSIVDDQSQSSTAGWLIEWVRKDQVRRMLVRTLYSRGTGYARNLSIFVSETSFKRGDYLYLSDNDVFFMEGWLDKLVQAFPLSRLTVLGGRGHPYHKHNSEYAEAGFRFATINAVGTQSWMMRWEDWDRYGPFDAHARGVRQSEDWGVCQRIRKEGREVGVILPHVILDTGKTDTFGNNSPGSEWIQPVQGVLIE